MKFCGQCRYFSISIQKSTSFFCQELPHKWQVLSESRLQPPLIWTLRLHHHSVTLNISRLSKSDPFTRFVRDCGILPLPEFCSSPGPWVWHRAAAGTCHICSWLCPVSSLEPGNGRTNTYRVSWHALTSPSPLARVQSLMFPSLFVIYFSQIFVIIWQLRYFCSVLILLWCVGW